MWSKQVKEDLDEHGGTIPAAAVCRPGIVAQAEQLVSQADDLRSQINLMETEISSVLVPKEDPQPSVPGKIDAETELGQALYVLRGKILECTKAIQDIRERVRL